MLHQFKKFRKRHHSIDSVITLLNSPGSRRKAAAAEVIAPKLILVKKDEELEETELGGGDVLLEAGGTEISDGKCVLRYHLIEPKEVDQPIRCPHPEHGIIQDGRALRLRAPSIKRRGALPFLTNEEAQSKRWSTAPSDTKIFPTASAPETSFKTILPY